MPDSASMFSVLGSLNTLAGGFFLLAAFGIVATRQVKACLNLYILQSLFLAASAFLLAAQESSWHMVEVGVVNLIAKPILIPWIITRTLRADVYTRREIVQALNIPISLLIALALVIIAYLLAVPIQGALASQFHSSNIPIGFAGLFLGAFTLTVRREAVPMLIGLLAMENGAFFAGIMFAHKLPLLAELAVTADGLIVAFIIALLIRAAHQHVGTTAIGAMTALKEVAGEK